MLAQMSDMIAIPLCIITILIVLLAVVARIRKGFKC